MRDDLANHRRVPACDQPSLRRHKVDQKSKSLLDRFEVGVDVGVVVFDVVEKNKLRQVVEELRSFIKVSGVILVAFNEKPVRLANSEARIEVLGYTTDEKR